MSLDVLIQTKRIFGISRMNSWNCYQLRCWFLLLSYGSILVLNWILLVNEEISIDRLFIISEPKPSSQVYLCFWFSAIWLLLSNLLSCFNLKCVRTWGKKRFVHSLFLCVLTIFNSWETRLKRTGFRVSENLIRTPGIVSPRQFVLSTLCFTNIAEAEAKLNPEFALSLGHASALRASHRVS